MSNPIGERRSWTTSLFLGVKRCALYPATAASKSRALNGPSHATPEDLSLQTTTIYVRVAKPTDGRAVTSPLDVMTRKQAARAKSARPSAPSVGRLGIHLKPEPSENPVFRKAKVTLSIQTNAGPVYLTGIVASEVRRGWVNLEIPPLEQWEEPLRWLSRVQRERIEEPGFYELLQGEIPKRLLQLTPG
ncbi:MAG: hypothetical protein ISR77_08225 [Pirellulaceae bacterium]|nr:hypothetical protein [Pirellulaceae bacterium]